MSTSTLYRVYKTKAKSIAEYRNGWGTAPILWGYLCEEYLAWEYSAWLCRIFGVDNQPLWNLRYDELVPRNVRLVHALCCDETIIPPKDFKMMADACDEVYSITKSRYPDNANHWSDIAKDIRFAKADKRCLGIGLSCTSVCDNWMSWKGGETHTVFDLIGENS